MKNCGYLLQYYSVGIIYGGLPATLYGFFIGYMNVPSYVYSTASVIMTMPWSFKFFLGLLNDCVPIMGLRRKPYMCIGWTVCTIFLLILIPVIAEVVLWSLPMYHFFAVPFPFFVRSFGFISHERSILNKNGVHVFYHVL